MSEIATTSSEAAVRVEYRLSHAEIAEATRLRLFSLDTLRDVFARTSRRRAPQLAWVARGLNCILAGMLLFAAGAAYLGATIHPGLLILELLPLGILVFIVLGLRKSSAANLRKWERHPMFQQDCTVVIDDHGVLSTRATCRYELDWSGALRLSETKSLVMVVDCEPRALIIPKRVLNGEQLGALRRLARARIPR